MRDHELGADQLAGAGPRAERAPQDHAGLLLRAAAGGRAGLLGAGGLLGLQRAVGNAAVGAALEEERAPVSPVHDVVASGGNALDGEVRSDMEARLGHDFGDVRVHTDSAAHDSAKAVNAHAYTVGSHIVFQRDAYDPGSHQGRTTLAHELTHVVQQRSGPVDGTPAAGGIAVSDPGDRFEREAAATAERVMAAPAVQRDVEEEEPSVQGLFVQRTEAPEEDEAAASQDS
ncbi:DUF4157 domain-containing protein [Kitasatospora sp. NPDC059747]|uniref:eCIS core domain-containing protein n=1 Tax=Kitasatospora sp. NPDC059747 TaxID=3346930 RepID=UPI00364C2E02